MDTLYQLMKMVWTKGKDFSFDTHFKKMQQVLGIQNIALDVAEQLQKNDLVCEMKSQPNLPVLELRIDGQTFVFNSLYRVWMIESIFSNVLEEKYKTENETGSETKYYE